MPSDSRFEEEWLPLDFPDAEVPELLLPPGHHLVVLRGGRRRIAVDVLDIADYVPPAPLTAS